MKQFRKALLPALSLALLCLYSQAQENFKITKLSKVYQQREARVSASLKATLVEQRKFLAEKKLKFYVANTAVSEMKLENITGALPINQSDAEPLIPQLRNKVLAQDLRLLLKKYRFPNCGPTSKAYDSRNYNFVPAIRFQHCGNCWSYSATGALECSYIKVSGITAPTSIDLSEKQLVSCSGAGSCAGGWPFKVFEFLKSTHTKVMSEASAPDDGTDHPCPATPANASVQLLDWGTVRPDGNLFAIASVADIKQAICTYGSVSVCLMATPLFQNFGGGGVFYENPSDPAHPSINHAVVLIGWDDAKQAWLLRNSWSTGWGTAGYCWINYNTNNIGYGAIWCVAKQRLLLIRTHANAITR